MTAKATSFRRQEPSLSTSHSYIFLSATSLNIVTTEYMFTTSAMRKSSTKSFAGDNHAFADSPGSSMNSQNSLGVGHMTVVIVSLTLSVLSSLTVVILIIIVYKLHKKLNTLAPEKVTLENILQNLNEVRHHDVHMPTFSQEHRTEVNDFNNTLSATLSDAVRIYEDLTDLSGQHTYDDLI